MKVDEEIVASFNFWTNEECENGLGQRFCVASTYIVRIAALARTINTNASGFITRVVASGDDAGEFQLLLDGYLTPQRSNGGVLTIADLHRQDTTLRLREILKATRSREFIQPPNTLNGYLLKTIQVVFEKPPTKDVTVTIYRAPARAIGWMACEETTAKEAGFVREVE